MPDSEIERNKALVRQFFDLYTRVGVNDALHLLAEDAVWSFPARSRMAASFTKPEAAKNFGRIMAMFEGKMAYTIHSMTAEADRVAVEFEGFGELKNGRSYNNLYHFLFVIRDGAIASIKEYMDTLYVVETLFSKSV
jgi:ketosteroid isomerase-like protein